MSNVTGVVEVIMTNKFNADKIAMKLEGNDTWFSQSKEWMELMPNRGDTVSFSPGKGKDGAEGKYIQYLSILESATPEKGAVAKSGGGSGFNALGVELGHAANNAVALAIAQGYYDMDSISQLTKDFYAMMKEVRGFYESKEVVQKEAPKASASKAKPKAAKKPDAEADFDDDIPF